MGRDREKEGEGERLEKGRDYICPSVFSTISMPLIYRHNCYIGS